jgi:hypothetical protein
MSMIFHAETESRFQRSGFWIFDILGRCPRLEFELAPSALNTVL